MGSKWGPVAKGAYLFFRNRALGRPRFANIEVTWLCNARCGTCDSWKHPPETELKDYSPVIQKIDPLGVSLCGGEPTVRRDLPDVVRKLRDNCNLMFITLMTHGGQLTAEKAKVLKEAGVTNISFSLDFIGEKHDQQRGIKNLYAHLSEIIPQVVKLGFRGIQTHTIISDWNLDHLIPIAEQAKKWGIQASFTTYNSLKVGPKDFWVPPEHNQELQRRIQELIEYKKRNRHVNNSEWYFSQIPGFFRGERVPNCKAGQSWIHILPDGHIKPCSETAIACHWTEYQREKVTANGCTACWMKSRESQAPLTPRRAWEYVYMFVGHTWK
jgi:MoaA/NifB/PqqE/SkfB family radical SAM enzyme